MMESVVSMSKEALYNGRNVVEYAFEHSHPNTKGWFLTDPRHVIGILAAFVLTVVVLKKWIDARGKGFNLKPIVLVHNAIMCLLSLYMFIECARQLIINRYYVLGNPIDESPSGFGMTRILYIFYLSKIWEFFDTFLMILTNKSARQLSFLHLYHHASILLICYAGVVWFPGGDTYFTCIWNTLVHVFMYFYYFCSSIAGRPKKGVKLTWKMPAYYRKAITSLQIVQFICMIVGSFYDLFVPSEYPRAGAIMLATYISTLLVLFVNFYIKAYWKPKSKDLKPKEA